MSTIASVGWALQVSRSAHLDGEGKEVYAVNLVRPAADVTSPWMPKVLAKRGPQISGSTVVKDFESLLFPWRWTNTEWKVFTASDPAGPWTPLKTPCTLSYEPDSVDPGAVETLRDRVQEKHVRDRVKACDFAFSGDPADAGDALGPEEEAVRASSTVSIPHAMGPLTHLPAALSNGLLRLAGFLAIPADDLPADSEYIACFPRFESGAAFDLDGDPVADGSLLRAEYDQSVQGAAVHFWCNAAGRKDEIPMGGEQAPEGEGESGRKGGGLADKRTAYELAEQLLHPLRTVVRALELGGDEEPRPTPKDRKQWRRALLLALGRGWERAQAEEEEGIPPPPPGAEAAILSTTETARHVFEYLATPADLTLVFPGQPAGVPALSTAVQGWLATPDDCEARFQGFAAALPKDRALREHMRMLCDPDTDDAGFLTCWAEAARLLLSSEERRPIFEAWWRFLLEELGQPGPARTALSERLSRAATPDLLTRAGLGTLESLHDSSAFWIALRAYIANQGEEDKTALRAWVAEAAAELVPLPEPILRTAAGLEVDGFIHALSWETAPDRSVARDRGLLIALESEKEEDPGVTPLDYWIRGYAVALESALVTPEKTEWDERRAQWITHTGIVSDGASVDHKDGGPLLVPETVGSSLQDGQRVIEIEYTGGPTTAIHQSEGEPGAKAPVPVFDYRWPEKPSPPLPMLGYGQLYRAAKVAIDNAGGIVDPGKAGKPGYRSGYADLKPPHDVLQAVEETIPYRSAERVSAPTIDWGVEARDLDRHTALSEETRAHVFLARTFREKADAAPAEGIDPEALPRVVMLAYDESDPERAPGFAPTWPRSYSLSVIPPRTHPDFVHRWLSTDVLALEQGNASELSDERFGENPFPGAAEALRTFRDALCARDELGRAQRCYHPGVSALGIAVQFDGGGQESEDVHTFERTRWNKEVLVALDPAEQAWPVGVRVGSTGEASKYENGIVTIRRGGFARIRFYCLVRAELFAQPGKEETSKRRYAPMKDVRLFEQDEVQYYGFGPQEAWFEAAPPWAAPQEEEEDVIGVRLELPAATQATCVAESRVGAEWLRGVTYQRHGWHWTGLPVQLPAEPGGAPLDEWLASFAGAESYRESGVHDFATTLDPADGSWRIGSAGGDMGNADVVDRHHMVDGPRPGRYTAYIARPRVRFRGMLDPKAADGALQLEHQLAAAGRLIPGIAVSPATERLGVPALRWSIPLTAGYEAPEGQKDPGASEMDADLPRRTANGNMLVFDEPLRRTDDQARVGGLGEVYELDLLRTRAVVTKEGPKQFAEIGPNPIFHALEEKRPSAEEPNGEKELSLDSSPPFGLTYDIVRNAAVAQTGVVVRPVNAEGRWIMAKVRCRRLILPETQLGGELPTPPDRTNGGSPPRDGDFSLGVRHEGEVPVPLDFALDFAEGEWPTTVELIGPVPLKLSVPAKPQRPGPLRLLCTWHKERWGGSAAGATWRAQLLAQARRPKALEWDTVTRVSGEAQSDWDPANVATPPTLRVDGATPSGAWAVNVSDYTAPQWLTFIGSFGQERLGRVDEYFLTPRARGKGEKARLAGLTLGGSAPRPFVTPPPAEPDDWEKEDNAVFQLLLVFRPVSAVTRGDIETTAGTMVAVFRPTAAGGSDFEPMPLYASNEPDLPPDAMDGCYAYLLSFQRITAPAKPEESAPADPRSAEERCRIDSWRALVDAVFRTDVQEGAPPRESLVRPLPMYLGPIEVVLRPDRRGTTFQLIDADAK